MEWVATGRVFSAQEALEGGLVRSVHPAEELLGVARGLAREIAEHTAPVSVALARQLLWRMLGAAHPMEAHRADSRAMVARGRSADVVEGVTAFLEKRPAVFPDRVSDGLPEVFARLAAAGVPVSFSAADGRAQLLAELERAIHAIGGALTSLGDAYEWLDDGTADRMESELFRPVQAAYGRAQRTHSAFSERHRRAPVTFASAGHAGHPGDARGALERASGGAGGGGPDAWRRSRTRCCPSRSGIPSSAPACQRCGSSSPRCRGARASCCARSGAEGAPAYAAGRADRRTSGERSRGRRRGVADALTERARARSSSISASVGRNGSAITAPVRSESAAYSSPSTSATSSGPAGAAPALSRMANRSSDSASSP